MRVCVHRRRRGRGCKRAEARAVREGKRCEMLFESINYIVLRLYVTSVENVTRPLSGKNVADRRNARDAMGIIARPGNDVEFLGRHIHCIIHNLISRRLFGINTIELSIIDVYYYDGKSRQAKCKVTTMTGAETVIDANARFVPRKVREGESRKNS